MNELSQAAVVPDCLSKGCINYCHLFVSSVQWLIGEIHIFACLTSDTALLPHLFLLVLETKTFHAMDLVKAVLMSHNGPKLKQLKTLQIT